MAIWQPKKKKSNLQVLAESEAVCKKAVQDTTEEILGSKSRRIPPFLQPA